MSTAVPKIPYPSAGKADRAGVGMGPQFDLMSLNDFAYNVQEFTFAGDTLPDEIDVATNGTGAAVAATATTGKGITLTTGTSNDGYAGVALALDAKGDDGLLAEFFVEMPATITTMKIEAGVTDALADAGAVLVKATPTATATDYGVFVFDTDDDTALAFHSAKAGTIVATEGLATVAGSNKIYMAVRVDGDNVQAWYQVGGFRNLQSVSGHGGGAGIDGASALTPWVFAQARAGSASRILTVRKIRITTPVQ